MPFASILAVTDFSAGGDHAVERAAQLAMAHGATLKLLYAPMWSHPVCADPATRMARNASAVSSRLGLTVHTADARATTLEQVAREAMGANVLVIPHRRERTLQALLCGQRAVRLATRCHCPILVVQRKPRMPFRRILVAVDFTPPSQHLAMLACTVDKEARVELFHAVNTVGESRLRQADVSLDVIKTYRQGCIQYAQQRMTTLMESLGANAKGILSAIGRGDPARQAVDRQEYVGAELLVVGKRRSTALADCFLGSTARRVLGHATCDVLVVPHGFRASTGTAAKLRLRTGSGIGHRALGCTKGITP